MIHARLLGVTLIISAGASMGYAAPMAPTVASGTIACLSLKNAKNYAAWHTEAPAFAQDLLDRAACYVLNEPATAPPQGRPEQGFQAYQLLSGHKVWVPIAR